MWNKIKKLFSKKKKDSRPNRVIYLDGYHIDTKNDGQEWFFNPEIIWCNGIRDGVCFSSEDCKTSFVISLKDLKDMVKDAELICTEIEKTRPNFRNEDPIKIGKPFKEHTVKDGVAIGFSMTQRFLSKFIDIV